MSWPTLRKRLISGLYGLILTTPDLQVARAPLLWELAMQVALEEPMLRHDSVYPNPTWSRMGTPK